MKKILALALALLIVGSSVALTACGNKDKNKDPNTENPGEQGDPGTQDPGENEEPGTIPDEQEPTDPADITFTAVTENVKATVTVELRVSPALDVDNVIGNLRIGEIVARTGISTDGTWSRVHMTPAGFDEGDYYVSSNCLVVYEGQLPQDEPADPGVTDPDQPGTDPSAPGTDPSAPDTSEFVTISPSETVYVITDALNLRSAPSTGTDAKVVGTALLAQALERTAKNDKWSRISYLGGEYYVYSDYVTTQNITGNDYVSLTSPRQMTVTAAQSLNVRNYPYVSDDSYVERLIILGGLTNGDTVTVIAEAPDKEWVRINWENGSTAYVRAKFLSGYGGASTGPSTPAGTTPGTPSTSVAFTPLTPVTMYPASSGVRAFTEPNDLSTVASTLSMSTPVLVTAVSTDSVWYKVQLEANSTTYYYVQAANLTSGGKS